MLKLSLSNAYLKFMHINFPSIFNKGCPSLCLGFRVEQYSSMGQQVAYIYQGCSQPHEFLKIQQC